jgi:[acyl-carrier-protein] S-malonyltransferase
MAKPHSESRSVPLPLEGVDLIILPGQGWQHKIPEIPEWLSSHPEQYQIYVETFTEADRYLENDFAADNIAARLADICFNRSPENEALLATDHKIIQTSILATEVALWRVFKSLELEAKYIAGHSLGEYAAMVVAGILTFKDALIAVYERAKAMEESAKNMPEEGGMAVVTGLDEPEINDLLEELGDDDTKIANHNSLLNPQFVLTGLKRNVALIVAHADSMTKVRASLMKIPGAYHHPKYGYGAAEKLKHRFGARKVQFNDANPNIKFLGNQETFIKLGAEAHDHAVEQLRRGVKWATGMKKAVEEEGVKTAIEIGAGRVLTSLAERDFKGKLAIRSIADYLKERRPH